jgi:hypothetical protein
VRAAFNFVNAFGYELEKINSFRLRGVMCFRGPGSEGADDGAWRADGTDASSRRSDADHIGASANARR